MAGGDWLHPNHSDSVSWAVIPRVFLTAVFYVQNIVPWTLAWPTYSCIQLRLQSDPWVRPSTHLVNHNHALPTPAYSLCFFFNTLIIYLFGMGIWNIDHQRDYTSMVRSGKVGQKGLQGHLLMITSKTRHWLLFSKEYRVPHCNRELIDFTHWLFKRQYLPWKVLWEMTGYVCP